MADESLPLSPEEERRARKRAYNHAYRAANLERLRAASRAYERERRPDRREEHHAWHQANKPRVQQRQRAYYVEHAEHLKAVSRAYRGANGPEVLRRRRDARARDVEAARTKDREYVRTHAELEQAKQRRYRTQHPERLRQTARQYRARHREEYNARQRQRYARRRDQDPTIARVATAIRRARKAQAPRNDLSRRQQRELLAACAYQCVYCEQLFPPALLVLDHLTPLSEGGSNTVQNVLPACGPCNRQKWCGPVLHPVQPFLLTVALPRKLKAEQLSRNGQED